MRYFLTFSYRGTAYHGSQTQPNGITVQEVLEQAMATLLRRAVPLTFAGRTDAGVHATQMMAHFDWQEEEAPLPENLVSRLNNLLPADIAIESLRRVTDDAHARFSATARTYHYRVIDHKSPFNTYARTRVPATLDYEAMNRAAQLLLGRHDFASFCKVHTDVKTTYCTVTEARWITEEDGCHTFIITADRFLRNMVRAVVGTLFEVGRGRMDEAGFQRVIDSLDRCAAAQSAEGCGLYLVKVEYPSSIFPPL